MKNAVEDLKTLKTWVLGIISFATAVSAFLVQVLNFRPEPTIIAVAGFAIAMIVIVVFISRSETRQHLELKNHIDESASMVSTFSDRLDNVDKALLEIQRSSLRIEMNDEITRHPYNHDTILKMAEKYFCDMKGDWYMTNRFLDWVEKEHIHLPAALMELKRD